MFIAVFTNVNGNVVFLVSFCSVLLLNKLSLYHVFSGLILGLNKSFTLTVFVVDCVVVFVGVIVCGIILDTSGITNDGIALAVLVTLGVDVTTGVDVLQLLAAAEEDAACCFLASLFSLATDNKLDVLPVILHPSSAIYIYV
jgi:hypothetical protein